jgi:hypothetical protein
MVVIMNRKFIAAKLDRVFSKWVSSIENDEVRTIASEHSYIAGGAIVSLFLDEKPKDYDIYFDDFTSMLKIINYYVNKYNAAIESPCPLQDSNCIKMYFNEEQIKDIGYQKLETLNVNNYSSILEYIEFCSDTADSKKIFFSDLENMKDKSLTLRGYQVGTIYNKDASKVIKYFSSNAISLPGKIQLVMRLYGSHEVIMNEFDFEHCKCIYDQKSYRQDRIKVGDNTLEAILNRELVYTGSKFSLSSFFRIKKYIKRGWSINAGQMLKIAFQMNKLDLENVGVLKDQLTGVDLLYFDNFISQMKDHMEEHKMDKVDETFLFDLVEKIF